MIKNNYKALSLKALSLIELLVTMSIVTVLLGISYGTLASVKLESRRKEAHSELIKLKANIEQTAISNSKSVMEIINSLPPQDTPNRYYNIKASTTEPSSYTLTATAIGTQEKDKKCPTILLIVSADSSGVSEDKRQSPECWK